MAEYYFERECRTPQSECYTILEDETAVGRVDIHYTSATIHATLSVSESITSDGIQDLIDTIDEELLDAVGISRQEVIVHVHQGRDMGVYSMREDFDGNGNGTGYQLMG